MFKVFVLLLLNCLISAKSFAQSLPTTPEFRYGKSSIAESQIGQFVAPNEWHQEDTLPIIKDAPKGAYVAVGTERGFVGASLTPNATHLILTDFDPDVVEYNRINIALLAVANDRQDYLKLRQARVYSEWKGRLPLTREQFSFWRTYQNQLTEDNSYYVKFDMDVLQMDQYFIGSSYLKDDKLFAKLQKMARENKLQAVLLDYSNLEGVKKFVSDLIAAKIKISVFDPSNAWVDLYTLSNLMDDMLNEIRRATLENSRLLVSRGYIVPYWLYAGYTFGYIDKIKSMKRKFQDVLTQTFAYMDNTIYKNTPGERVHENPLFREFINKVQSPLFENLNACITALPAEEN